jgi:hypothetical protein
MSTTSLTSVFRELFVAPLSAAYDSEREYRKIWAEWLKGQKNLLDGANVPPDFDMKKILALSPVINLDGVIEVGITMRIAGVQEFNAELKVGLSVGPIYGAGGFGFVNRTSQESVFQASTRYVISNFERNLQKYLEARSITLAQPKDIETAITALSKSMDGIAVK